MQQLSKYQSEEVSNDIESTNETKSINETTRLINNSYANVVTVIKTRSSVKGKNGNDVITSVGANRMIGSFVNE